MQFFKSPHQPTDMNIPKYKLSMISFAITCLSLWIPGTRLILESCQAKSTKQYENSSILKNKEEQKPRGEKCMPKIYTFKARGLDGKEIDFSNYKGDVLLIVNTASKCGFTPQYAGLEKLYQKYSGRGLIILGFPCNQFGNQEPGDNETIATFCQQNYDVNFQMFEKIDVNGKDAHPLYKYLTSTVPGALGSEAIKWNFTKFLVNREGNVLKRYAPSVKPEDIALDIEKAL